MKFIVNIILAFSSSLSLAISKSELRIGMTQEFETLNPVISSMMATTYLYAFVGRTLNTLDEKGQWIPQLAKNIPTLENKQAQLIDDKKIVARWEIRENANWGDGKPVTCADYAFTREVALHDNVPTAEREGYRQIESITWEEKTPKKCVFTFNKPLWDHYKQATFRILPKHIEEPIFRKYSPQKESYEKNSEFVKNPTAPGLYNGPYVVSELKLGSHISFTPNPHFYGKKPEFQKIIVKLIPNTGTLEANLRSGTIDIISSLGMTFDQALSFSKKVKSENLNYEVIFKPGLTYEHIDLDLNHPILKDIKVRQALVYAINREELTNALFEGKQKPAVHDRAHIDPWFTQDPKKIKIYNYDKEKAASLLDESGWKINSADGYRYKDGKKLSFLFMTTAGNRNREVVQTFLQGQWKKVGVEVNIKNEPAKVFFGETMKKRNYKGLAMYAWISSPESIPRSTLHTNSIPSDKNGWAGQNSPGWSNPKADMAIEKLETEFNAKKRISLAQEVQKYYTEDVPVIPLYYRSDVAVIPKNLVGYEMTGTQYPETNKAENWSVKN